MPIMSIKIMKTIYEKEMQRLTNQSKQRHKKARETEAIVKG